uniref:Uncharacterized protein n=1 Tax=Oryza barthii TaxID=65489 RepID=A0A0D3HX57_9ORYZ
MAGDGDPQEAEAIMAGNKRTSDAETETETRKKMKEEVTAASPTADNNKKKKILAKCEGGEILKKKKLALDSMSLWKFKDMPGAIDLWIESRARAEAAIAAGKKKRKKLFKTRVPNGRVEFMMKHRFSSTEPLSDEELANCSASYRQLYGIAKFIDRKMNDYEQLLIDQYVKQGYAEEETEATDDDE